MQYEVSGNPHCLKVRLFEESLSVKEGRLIYKTERIRATPEGLEGAGEAGIESEGKIKILRLEEGDSVYVREGRWLAHESSLAREGAEHGLSRFMGPGILFIEAGGDFFDFMLEEGERLEVHEGNLVALDPTVTFEGKGDFILVSGPGAIMVQTHRATGGEPEKKGGAEGLFGTMFG